MLRLIFGIFIILHGLVHMLYFGQSQKLFELQEGMTWPDGSWAFSGLLGNATTRSIAGILLVTIAFILVIGGIGVFGKWALWRSIVIGGSLLSSIAYLLLWNGKMQRLDNQGLIGILVNLAILFVLLVLNWPRFET
ncbi:MAG: hypothetical protein C3F07_18375 [Anaerolineales bacterium]|nr:hypothetical protein [Anaerolineae bacterium]PWB69908.1 MAG: hypothetical protein C3F07_18375 [Anaerolineales bacterium]